MKVRRVVTGHTVDGMATVAYDMEVDAITVAPVPGIELHRVWGANETPTLPDDGPPPMNPTFFPPVGGFRFGLFILAWLELTTVNTANLICNDCTTRDV